jgi:hypothetical protein
MFKVNLPDFYRPNVSLFYIESRKRWILEYELPSKEGNIRKRTTLPKRFLKKDEKKVKKNRKTKGKRFRKRNTH